MVAFYGVEHLDDTTIRVRLPAHERHVRPGGTISGPTLVWLVDLGFYLLLLGRLGPVALAVTTNLNINFMRKPAPWPSATSPSGARA